MNSILSFKNVSSHIGTDYAINRLSLDFKKSGRYLIKSKNIDQKKNFLLVIEHRKNIDGGIIQEEKKSFIQLDHQLLGQKVISEKLKDYLVLEKNEFIRFEERTRSKEAFIDKLKIKRLLGYPIYKLPQEKKIDFALLALLFQQKGLIIISEIFILSLTEEQQNIFDRICLNSSSCLIFCETENLASNYLNSIPLQRELIEVSL